MYIPMFFPPKGITQCHLAYDSTLVICPAPQTKRIRSIRALMNSPYRKLCHICLISFSAVVSREVNAIQSPHSHPPTGPQAHWHPTYDPLTQNQRVSTMKYIFNQAKSNSKQYTGASLFRQMFGH